jgi:hypothetical protein
MSQVAVNKLFSHFLLIFFWKGAGHGDNGAGGACEAADGKDSIQPGAAAGALVRRAVLGHSQGHKGKGGGRFHVRRLGLLPFVAQV